MIFLDASVIVSVVSKEVGYRKYIDALTSETDFVTSPLAQWEAVIAIRRKASDAGRPIPVSTAMASFDVLRETIDLSVEPIAETDSHVAIEAFARYGHRSRSPANLNMGDCFHYAVAKRLGASILFTSPDEFHHTDLACAVARP